MELQEYKNILIKEGIRGVKEDNRMKEHEVRGSIDGFNICKNLFTIDEFITELNEQNKIVNQAFKDSCNNKITIEEYWEKRYVQIQVEFIFDSMKIAWQQAGINIFPSLSANKAIRFNEILQENEDAQKN